MKRIHRHPLGFIALVALSVSGTWSHQGHADAPVGRYDVKNGTVLDTKTKLMWRQAVAPNALNWNDAKAYCDGLVWDAKSDWRLPNVKELQTIVDEKKINPSIDPTAFPNTPNEYFWTSSPWAGSGSAAWLVYFFGGDTNYGDVANTYRVRCVR